MTKMATKKKNVPEGNKQETMFTKEQILASNKYANRKDVINAIWLDDSTKTISQIDDLIDRFMKGKVKR
jgi:hypothetical protein